MDVITFRMPCCRYYGCAIGKAKQTAKTEMEKLKLANMTCRELVKEAAKIIHIVHDEVKDKDFELELSWVCEESEGLHQAVPQAVSVFPHNRTFTFPTVLIVSLMIAMRFVASKQLFLRSFTMKLRHLLDKPWKTIRTKEKNEKSNKTLYFYVSAVPGVSSFVRSMEMESSRSPSSPFSFARCELIENGEAIQLVPHERTALISGERTPLYM